MASGFSKIFSSNDWSSRVLSYVELNEHFLTPTMPMADDAAGRTLTQAFPLSGGAAQPAVNIQGKVRLLAETGTKKGNTYFYLHISDNSTESLDARRLANISIFKQEPGSTTLTESKNYKKYYNTGKYDLKTPHGVHMGINPENPNITYADIADATLYKYTDTESLRNVQRLNHADAAGAQHYKLSLWQLNESYNWEKIDDYNETLLLEQIDKSDGDLKISHFLVQPHHEDANYDGSTIYTYKVLDSLFNRPNPPEFLRVRADAPLPSYEALPPSSS